MEKLRFVDAAEREWFCRVDWAAIRRSVAAGVDLSGVEEHLGDFHRGSVKLLDALWAVLGPAAKERDLTRERFEDGIKGDAIDRGREALLAGCADFFPTTRGLLMLQADAEVGAEIRALVKRPEKPSTELPEKWE